MLVYVSRYFTVMPCFCQVSLIEVICICISRYHTCLTCNRFWISHTSWENHPTAMLVRVIIWNVHNYLSFLLLGYLSTSIEIGYNCFAVIKWYHAVDGLVWVNVTICRLDEIGGSIVVNETTAQDRSATDDVSKREFIRCGTEILSCKACSNFIICNLFFAFDTSYQ